MWRYSAISALQPHPRATRWLRQVRVGAERAQTGCDVYPTVEWGEKRLSFAISISLLYNLGTVHSTGAGRVARARLAARVPRGPS